MQTECVRLISKYNVTIMPFPKLRTSMHSLVTFFLTRTANSPTIYSMTAKFPLNNNKMKLVFTYTSHIVVTLVPLRTSVVLVLLNGTQLKM